MQLTASGMRRCSIVLASALTSLALYLAFHIKFHTRLKMETGSIYDPSPATILDVQRAYSHSRECGQICSTEFDSGEEGPLYPLLRKKVDCDNIMYRVAFSPFEVVKPPPRHPPTSLLNDFTMDGQCVLAKPLYYDDSATSAAFHYSNWDFNTMLALDRIGVNLNHYRDRDKLKPALTAYNHAFRDKHVAVVGTEVPWAEAMLLNLGAQKVTTLEYRELFIDHPQVEVITPPHYAGKFLNRTSARFDASFTYSSIEHTGLGRYGDPLMPYGDTEALAQIWCATKPGGYLFLALPMTENRRGCTLTWNALRRYGYSRMQHLTANWRVLDEVELLDGFQQFLYVLQKTE